jgi:CRP-like cAMP-binding protein
MANTLPKEIQNELLSRLAAEDFAAIEPHLKPVDLPLRAILETRNRAIEHAYFLEHGFASVVANGNNGGIEVGLIGREGMTGLAVVMGADRTPHDVFMQNAGSGWRISATELRRATKQRRGLLDSILLFAHAYGLQANYTAIANGRASLEERLARWLLMAHDRGDGDELRITQEFLAQMLAVRRPGVTVAIKLLIQSAAIRVVRGTITIVDRKELMKISNGIYGVPEAELKRLYA